MHDSFGEMEVPQEALYGAQTARSLIHFNIGQDKMPAALIRAYGLLKRACAEANHDLGALDNKLFEPIVKAAEEVAAGKWMDHFPLSIWQTGSGTQTHMNINEVIATRASQISGLEVHPNDHVNMSQSTNDTFPSAMYIAAAREMKTRLIPRVERLREALKNKGAELRGVIKIGRTHLMDAVPIKFEDEFLTYAEQLSQNLTRLEQTLPRLQELPIGGTAVGSGLNALPGFAERVVQNLTKLTEIEFSSPALKYPMIAANDALVFAHSALKTLAVSLNKIASDLGWMVSGPRAGIGELKFQPTEPGSSIMPGKFNPSQCEALMMVCAHVVGHDAALSMAGASGHFELNTYKPMMIHNFLKSLELLADTCRTFTDHFVVTITPNLEQIDTFLNRSLMLATVLNPKIGYDKATEVAKKAYAEDTTLKEACLSLGYLSSEEFDKLVDPKKMV